MAIFRPTVPPIIQPTLGEIIAVNSGAGLPWNDGGAPDSPSASLIGQTYSRTGDGTYLTAAPNTGSSAFIALAALNVLRLEDRGDGAGPLVLLERESTNLNLRSTAFDNAAWFNFHGWTVTAGVANGPDGSVNTADRLAVVAAGGVRTLRQVLAAVAANSRITVSCWIRTESGTANFRIVGTDAPGNNQASADLTATTTWQRFSHSYNYGSPAVFPPEVGFLGDLGATAASFLAWGYQTEIARYPSSLINTVAATVARGADTLALTTTPSWLLTGPAKFRQFSPNFASTELASGDVRWLFTIGSASDGVRVRHTGVDVRVEAVQGGAVKASSAAQVHSAFALRGEVKWNPITGVVSVGGVAGAAGTPWTWGTGTVRAGGIQGGSGDELDGRLYPFLEAA